MKCGSLLLLSALAVAACGSQPRPPAVPASWTPVPVPPRSGTERQTCAGLLLSGWTLSVADNTLQARVRPEPEPRRDALPYEIDYTGAIDEPPPPPPPLIPDGQPRRSNHAWAIGYARDHARRAVMSVDGGWLVAFDAGEYGGSLWWYPSQPGPGRKLWDKNVQWLRRRGSDVLAIGGLAHLDLSEGVLLKLAPSTSGWGIATRHSLKGGPQVLTDDGAGRIVIVTTASVERVQGDATEVLASVSYPDFPHSAVVTPRGAIAVAVRMFINVLQPQNGGYRSEWYLPPRCLTYEMRQFECVCTGQDGA